MSEKLYICDPELHPYFRLSLRATMLRYWGPTVEVLILLVLLAVVFLA